MELLKKLNNVNIINNSLYNLLIIINMKTNDDSYNFIDFSDIMKLYPERFIEPAKLKLIINNIINICDFKNVTPIGYFQYITVHTNNKHTTNTYQYDSYKI